MDARKTSKLPVIYCNSGRLVLKILVCSLVLLANEMAFSSAAFREVEIFEGGGKAGIPDYECGSSGWSIQQTDDGNHHAFITCQSTCSHNVTVMEGAYFTLGIGTGTVSFHYALYAQGATSPQSGPLLSMYCEPCSMMSRVWTSSSEAAPVNGEWAFAEVLVKPSNTAFNLFFEASLQGSGQMIGLDNVVIQSGKVNAPPLPTIPLAYPANCVDDGDPMMQTPTFTQVSSDQPDLYGATTDASDTAPKNTFGLLDNETTLLFAQILAILSVSVCFITVGIHCLLWRKQRRLQRVSSVPLRPKPAAAEPHDSMLLEMNLVSTDELDQPCSNSLTEPAKTRYLQQLKESDIFQQPDTRRATVSYGSSVVHHVAVVDDEDYDTDDEQQRPHPRTKSLPCRPQVNVYESIDEISKYQPLTFGKRPAPGPPGPPKVPKGPKGRRNTRSLGVQNLAAVKKYRPSSVQYEEIGTRRNGLLLEELRDRSKSASHYDYVKRKSSSQTPRRNGWKYGQSPRPKGRAPPPPNRLYDEPIRKSRPAVKADSAPTLLLENQESSSGEGMRTDNESIQLESMLAYDRPSTSGTDVTRSAAHSTYFTLEPPIVTYATSEDSDDEHESERDIGRFEDAEETETLPNGAASIPLRPLSVSAPIDIPPPMSPQMADFDEESSCL